MTPDEFREYGHRVIDWIADYRARLAAHPTDQPVMSTATPGSIKTQLPCEPPATPESFDDVMRDFAEIVLPGVTHWQHPSFYGFFPATASLPAVLGDLMSSGLGVLGINWQACPALTELEETVVDWMRRMVDLSDAWQGVIYDTASTGNLCGLLCARERSTNFSLARGGLQQADAPLIVYVSTQSHSSAEKAALLAGFGRDNVRAIATDDSYDMRADLLEAAVQTDLAAGRIPCAVLATTGTTATTAFDPLDDIAAVAERHDLWLHVDAAMAGSAMILPECRELWRGIERADSLLFNPHKWLGTPFDCSLFFVRDVEHLIRVMSTSPSYLQSGADGRVKNYRDWGIPLGRRFRALKLWTLIRTSGVVGLQERLRRDLAHARWLERQVRQAEHWRVLAPVRLQTVCVRHEPPGLDDAALNQHTRGWAERLNQSGRAFVTPALVDGRWLVRVSFGTELTEPADVERLWTDMRAIAERP